MWLLGSKSEHVLHIETCEINCHPEWLVHHIVPPMEVTQMTAATYDMLGWEADLWIPARRTQTRVLWRSNVGKDGRVRVFWSSQLESQETSKSLQPPGGNSRIVSLLPVKGTRQTSWGEVGGWGILNPTQESRKSRGCLSKLMENGDLSHHWSYCEQWA